MIGIEIGERMIGEGEPCFIIAEAGVNHNGDNELAKKLIDAASVAGADAVKFQTFRAEELTTADAEKAVYQRQGTGLNEPQMEMLKGLELGREDFKKLSGYAKEKKIVFLSSPFDRSSVDLLEELEVPAFKIASGEITNSPLLEHVASKRKPIILSTGMSTLDEVKDTLEFLKGKGVEEIILLHCVTSYPARIEEMNLRAMETLRGAFSLPVGLSDHTLGITVPIAAVALGACVIEKHFTLDRNLPGPDHRASQEPEELKEMVTAIRDTELALGDGTKRVTSDEEEIKKVARRSIVANVDIPEGTVVTEEMVSLKRPGSGLGVKSMNLIVGCRTKASIKAGEIIALLKMV
ncbi:MAG: N-acetylneuraminate synthase [Dehalococcoidales bacterium]|jgi:N-acetylneuraminate synthase/N,N'-diacetyllegionaminate synthase|nr:N-acetylneuraminate synthase [Dehalococcoidales bacterium]